MKKLLKILISRMTLVILAILLEIALSIFVPYLIINYYNPLLVKVLFTSFDILLRIIGIGLFIRIINSKMNIEGQLGWSVLLLFLPLLGIILYFIFVRNRPPKRHRKYIAHTNNQIKQYQVKYKEEDEKLKEDLGDYYGQFEYIYNSTGLKTYANTNVEFLPSGERFYEELLKQLMSAQKFIFMEYFIIERGEMWTGILNILKQKVEQGVEVRVM